MGEDLFERELNRLQRLAITEPRHALIVLDEVVDLRARLIAARNQIAREAAALDRGLGAARAYGAAAQQKRTGR
jgi:hypothetical protein